MRALWRFYRSIYSHVCIVDSVYSLLIYIIEIDPKLEKTAFILGSAIHPTVRIHLPLFLSLNQLPQKGICKKILSVIWYYFFWSPLIKICLKKDCSYYGHDHLYFSNLLGKKYTVIEDGSLNYSPSISPSGYFFRTLTGIEKTMGYSTRAESIYLSGIQEIPPELIQKAIKFNLFHSWEKLTIVEKNNLLKIFGLSRQNQSPIDILLLTQPLSEDNLMSESDKNEIYKKILIEMNIKKVTIKTHPRETSTIYDFGDIEVNYINQSIPIELLSFTEAKINHAITLYSSSVFSLKASNKIIYGTENLIEKYKKLPLVIKKEFR